MRRIALLGRARRHTGAARGRPRGRVRRARRRERHHPAHPHEHARRVPRRRRALRDELRVHRQGEEVGSIVPLPGVPTEGRSGAATGRCNGSSRRCARRCRETVRGREPRRRSASAEVLLETKIDALDITILRGGGDAVGKWALDHGFLLTPDAPQVLDFYSQRSPIFMAARFDASRGTRARPERRATARRSC